MDFNKPENLQLLISNYDELRNVWKVGERMGVSGQRVHYILTREGKINKMNYLSEADKGFLAQNYNKYREENKLCELATLLNRTPQFISRHAKKMGLTERGKRPVAQWVKDRQSELMKLRIAKNGHPKAMLGKKHSEDFKKGASIRSLAMWANPDAKVNTPEFRQQKSDKMMKWQNERKDSGNNYNRVKRGTIEIGGKTFFARSSWEANIAAYLQFLKEHNEILDWEHEPETFWFEKIKRGVRSYLPDFKVTKNDGSFYFAEVKGWMDDKSKTKIKRMAI
jgi:hypothetical protein